MNYSSVDTSVVYSYVAVEWPKLFDPADPLPLAIGMYDMLLAMNSDLSQLEVKAFLRRWTGRTLYLRALTKIAHRYDLSGSISSDVTQDDRETASAELRRRSDKRFLKIKNTYIGWGEKWPTVFSRENPALLDEDAIFQELVDKTGASKKAVRRALCAWVGRREYRNINGEQDKVRVLP